MEGLILNFDICSDALCSYLRAVWGLRAGAGVEAVYRVVFRA